MSLKEIAAVQAKPTKHINKYKQLMVCATTCLDAKLSYFSRNMIRHVGSDAAYLVKDKAQNRIAGYHIT